MTVYRLVSTLVLIPFPLVSGSFADPQASKAEVAKTNSPSDHSQVSQAINRRISQGIEQSGAMGKVDDKTSAADVLYRPGTGTIIVAQLEKFLDAKKLKVGDAIECIVIQDLVYQGNIIVPRRAKVVGHVTETKVSTKEDPESRLGIIFDKIVLKNKLELEFQNPAIIKTLFSPSRRGTTRTTRLEQLPVQIEKGNSTAGSIVNAVSANASLTRADLSHTTGNINPASRGVIGIEGLTLKSSNLQESVIVSAKGNVKIGFDTQMVLEVTAK